MNNAKSTKRKSVSFETPIIPPQSPSVLGASTTSFHRPKPSKSQNKMSTFDSLESSKSLSRLQQIEGYYKREGIDPPRPVHQGPAHVYGSYQPQPTTLPEARRKNEHRLPNIIHPPRRKFSFDDPEIPLPSLDDSFEAAMKNEQEIAPIILQAHSPAPLKRSSTTFMNWFDIFVRDEKDPAIVYNIRTKEFRATNRSKVLQTEDEAVLINGNRSLAFEVDNPPLLCDGRMIIAPLPKFGGTVTIKWRHCAETGVHLREREVSLPAWVLTLRSLGKIDDIFVERV